MKFLKFKSSKCIGVLLLLALPIMLMAQAKLPAVWIGQPAPSLITKQPNFPKNEFVVVQLCDLRERCDITKFYVDELVERGVDISFYAVLDKTQESLRSLTDRYENYDIIDWGMHPSMSSANQSYLLGKDRNTIYQGVFRDWVPGLFEIVASESGDNAVLDDYFSQQVMDAPTSTGLFFQNKTIYPLNLAVGSLIAANSRGRMITIDPNIESLKLKKVPFKAGQVISDLIKSVNGNLAREQSALYYIKVLSVDKVKRSSNPDMAIKWADLLLSMGPDYGIKIVNFEALPRNAKYLSSPVIPVGLNPDQALKWLKDMGLEFEVESTEKINIITIK